MTTVAEALAVLAAAQKTATWGTDDALGCFVVTTTFYEADGSEAGQIKRVYLEDNPPAKAEEPAPLAPASDADVTIQLTGVEATGEAANLG